MFSPAVAAPRRSFSLRPSKKMAMILGAMMGGVVLLTGGLYMWQTDEIAKVLKEVAEKEELVRNGQRTADQLQTVQQEAQVVDGKLHYLEQNVSRGSYVPTLLQQMEIRARQHNLTVNSSRQAIEVVPPPPPLSKEDQKAGKKPPPPLPYDKARLEMDVTGSYRNVATFIHSLTHFEKIIAVTSVQQQARQEKPGVSPVLAVRLTMIGYVFKNDDAAPASEQKKAPLASMGERRAAERQLLEPNKK